jgi:MoxR-like ATPase
VLLGLLTGGHVLLEGVPGLAKTLTVNTLAPPCRRSFSAFSSRPTCCPPTSSARSSTTRKSGEFTPRKGPIFANIILADEINRAPAKVQSALLEAMQEGQVTIGDTTYPLPEPFLVLATQNPVEQEGTYPLPEAQVDRFMLLVKVGYPTREEEREIITRQINPVPPICAPSSPRPHRAGPQVVNEIYIDDKVKEYILDIVLATRDPDARSRGWRSSRASLIEYGASPRASIWLARAARAHAFMHRRGYVIPEDIKALAPDILRHRIIPTYEAEAEDVTSDDIVARILEVVEVP